MPNQESWTIDNSVQLAIDLTEIGVDLIDVSTGGIHPDQKIPKTGPGYQIPYTKQIGSKVDIPISTVRKITSP